MFAHPVYIERIGSRLYMKVTGAKNVKNLYSRNVKLWSAINLLL